MSVLLFETGLAATVWNYKTVFVRGDFRFPLSGDEIIKFFSLRNRRILLSSGVQIVQFIDCAYQSRPSEYVPGGRLVDVPRPKHGCPKTVLSLTEYCTVNEPRHGPRRKNRESMSNCYPNFDFDASSTRIPSRRSAKGVSDRNVSSGGARQVGLGIKRVVRTKR